MSDVQQRDPDDMSDDEFRAFQNEMATVDAELADDTPVAREEPKPEAAQDPEDLSDDELDDAAAKEKQESVPHGRFHRERERRKALETEMSDFRRRYELLEQRTNDLMQMRQPAQEPQKAAQSFQERYQALKDADDFIGAQELLAERMVRAEDERRQQETHSQRQRGTIELANRVFNDSKADLERAIADDPSVKDAYLFMREEGLRQLRDVEGLPEHVAMQQLDRYEMETFLSVLQRGQRPSEFVRRFANSRGFKAKAPEPDATPDIETQAANIERLNTAKLAAKTLSGAGSEARTTMPTPNDIVNMSDEEFAAFKKKHGDNAMSKAFGQ